MIRRIWSSLPTFREIQLEPGFNVILADRSESSGDKESVNGLGKTTFLRIIHFCLGSDIKKDKVLSHADLQGVDFGIDVDIGGKHLSVTRSTSKSEIVVVNDGGQATRTLDLNAWRAYLNKMVFGISDDDSEFSSHAPSFRSLFGYFARLGRNAFGDPFDFVGHQKAWVKQIHVSFLLGLDWRLVAEWNGVTRQIENARAFSSVTTDDERLLPSIPELKAEAHRLNLELSDLMKRTESFENGEYARKLAEEVEYQDTLLEEAVRQRAIDKSLLRAYRKALVEPTTADLEQFIGRLRQTFKRSSLRKLEDIGAFHSFIHSERDRFVSEEVERLSQRVTDHANAIRSASRRKADLLQEILGDKGDLDQIQAIRAQLAGIRAKIEERETVLETQRDAEQKRKVLSSSIKLELAQKTDALELSKAAFGSYTGHLYEKPGELQIGFGRTGIKFGVKMNRSGSDGVDQMSVFCFDLAIAKRLARGRMGPNFLIHDSTIFADVDHRQKAKALKLAEAESRANGFQYICCLNSDTIPYEHLGDFAISDYVRLRLNDSGPSGKLLGRDIAIGTD